MRVQWLFLDLNAFFASCEQQENPALRGQPVIVVQTPADSACAIAASYAAKGFGIKTGTLVKEARRICPDVIPVQANHRLYTDYHARILTAVDTCLPVAKVCSIDEMACQLMGIERQVPAARALALKVKRALRDQVGECLTCSIGLAPNVFLGKVGSDLQKPDGLVVITKDSLPEILLGLALQEIYGIGERMEQGFTAPASSPLPSSGTRRRFSCAGCGAASTACCSTRCCMALLLRPVPLTMFSYPRRHNSPESSSPPA
jgi:DNA polymerase IV